MCSAATGRRRHCWRLALPVSKFWVCKRAVPMIAEALECLGGNGYVEDSGWPGCSGSPR